MFQALERYFVRILKLLYWRCLIEGTDVLFVPAKVYKTCRIESGRLSPPPIPGADRQEIGSLRRVSDALRVELDDERRKKTEEVIRWQREAAAMKDKAVSAAKCAEKEGRGRAIAEARIASTDAGETSRRQEYGEFWRCDSETIQRRHVESVYVLVGAVEHATAVYFISACQP